MLQKIFGYKVELVEHSPEYTLVRADKAVRVGTQIPVRVSGANGQRTPAVPMVVMSCRAGDYGGFLITGRFLVDHPDLSGFEIPAGMGAQSALRADPRVNCHLCVISRDLPGYKVMTIDLSEGGLQVEAPARVALGNSVLLRIEFDTEKLPALQVAATVAWCQKFERGRFRIGLKFNNLDDRSAEVIGLYRQLLHRRAAADICTRTVRDEADFIATDVVEASGSMPTLQVFQWHPIPLFECAALVGYRREGEILQVRLRGGETGVRYREYGFANLRGMQDRVAGDPSDQPVAEFRFAEADGGFYRFQFLDENKATLLEIEAKSCAEQSSEQN
jgi:Tfp pilus assembly protein PilZ